MDIRALQAEGWRPSSFRQFIVKIHSRCDLSCDYCYMYEMADQSWRNQPRKMSEATVGQLSARIAEHVEAHGLSSIQLILHGGEPLLAGPELIAHTVAAVRQAVGPGVAVGASVQTNGVRLDKAFLRRFDDLGVRVGVSLDGTATGHDRHRRRPDGRGSHSAVVTGLSLLSAEYPHLFGGILCTIDVRNDPVRTYEALLGFQPPAVDFLLPHGNWVHPPPFLPDPAATPYADWLIAIFDRWYGARRQETEIRLFADIIHLLLGGESAGEAVGLAPARMVVIETDGGIEQSDTLKAAYQGAPATGFHVAHDTFDNVLLHPSLVVRQIGERALGGACLTCPVRRVCGGGLYAHRYHGERGFDGPSVFCRDMFHLITYIHHVVGRDVADLLEGRR
ncbi:FxsB family radical SAM/SPASM domain protein [Streptosporangium sp. KLBMP 9127]|nr:FxsB family radical SAM/SPASM domain protein [Streptosporangium sp. KLBMP 9127]